MHRNQCQKQEHRSQWYHQDPKVLHLKLQKKIYLKLEQNQICYKRTKIQSELPETKKPTTAPSSACRPEKSAVVIEVNNDGFPETVTKASVNLESSNESERKKALPIPNRPRSVKATLIKVASTDSSSKDLKSTYVIEQQNQQTSPKEEDQKSSEKPICKITINGKESTIPEYSLKTKNSVNRAEIENTDNIPGNVHVVTALKIDTNRKNPPDSDEVKFVPRPALSEHEGPVIWDPFERIREQNQKSTDHLDVKQEESKPRVKSAKTK